MEPLREVLKSSKTLTDLKLGGDDLRLLYRAQRRGDLDGPAPRRQPCRLGQPRRRRSDDDEGAHVIAYFQI